MKRHARSAEISEPPSSFTCASSTVSSSLARSCRARRFGPILRPPEIAMRDKIAIFWPGDARDIPNQLARPNIEEATRQLENALKKLGRKSYVVDGILSKPHHAIEKLGPITDPMIGVCVHWLYAPHTCDGVIGKDNPLLLASNFSGRWP